MFEAEVGRVLAEGLTITQRYERISPQHDNVARFQLPLPLLPWVDTSAHLFFRLYPHRDLPDPRQINFISLQLRSLQEILLSPNL